MLGLRASCFWRGPTSTAEHARFRSSHRQCHCRHHVAVGAAAATVAAAAAPPAAITHHAATSISSVGTAADAPLERCDGCTDRTHHAALHHGLSCDALSRGHVVHCPLSARVHTHPCRLGHACSAAHSLHAVPRGRGVARRLRRVRRLQRAELCTAHADVLQRQLRRDRRDAHKRRACRPARRGLHRSPGRCAAGD